VRFDERVEAKLRSDGHQPRHGPLVQVAQQQQHGIRPRLTQLPQLRLLPEEPLPEQRHISRRARRPQIVQ
jgi:hypothetical protein